MVNIDHGFRPEPTAPDSFLETRQTVPGDKSKKMKNTLKSRSVLLIFLVVDQKISGLLTTTLFLHVACHGGNRQKGAVAHGRNYKPPA